MANPPENPLELLTDAVAALHEVMDELLMYYDHDDEDVSEAFSYAERTRKRIKAYLKSIEEE